MARLGMNYTQQQVANLMGITKSAYCGYETGKRQPDVAKIKLLADILHTSGDTLLETGFGSSPENKTIEVYSVERGKISPSAAEAAPEEDTLKLLERLNSALVEMGFIGEEDDLTDRQFNVLLGMCTILRATFEKKQ